MSNGELLFAPENATRSLDDNPWVVLIVDDDLEVHSFTKLALYDFIYDRRGLEFLSAYSAAEAISIFETHRGIAVVLLDVVMETDTAGLDLVKVIRERFGNDQIRIIIRTGQPGMAPPRYVINHYDINDYKEKTELTADRLYITMRSSLSQYKHIMELEDKSIEILEINQNLESTISLRTRELKQQQHALDEHAIVAITDLNGTITFVNTKFEKISGYTRDELIGKNHRILNSGLHSNEFWEEMYHKVSHGDLWHSEVRDKAKDGTYYWVDATILGLMDAKGELEGYISIRTDITALKESARTIARKDEFLQTLLDSVAEGIYGIDVMGNCTFVNKSFLRILGYDHEDEVIGRHVHELTHHTRKNGTHYSSNECKIYKTNQAHKFAHVDDEVFWKRDGTCIDVEYWSYPMLRDGEYAGAVATFMDTTEQNKNKKEHEVRELQMIQQARLAQMGEMISMIAHQWRQPLAAIMAIAINMKVQIELGIFDLETIEGRNAQNHFFIEQFDMIDLCAQNLTTTIDDFRNFNKKDKPTSFTSFHAVTDKALAIVRSFMEADKIEIIEDYSNEIQIEMHENEILQVILSILKNAQDNFKEKAIRSPKIRILSCDNSLLICDNGGGIPQDILGKIFDPYFSTKDEKNGTGLGLYMSKTIIENHHKGRLIAYNQNDGVCFEIKLENIC